MLDARAPRSRGPVVSIVLFVGADAVDSELSAGRPWVGRARKRTNGCASRTPTRKGSNMSRTKGCVVGSAVALVLLAAALVLSQATSTRAHQPQGAPFAAVAVPDHECWSASVNVPIQGGDPGSFAVADTIPAGMELQIQHASVKATVPSDNSLSVVVEVGDATHFLNTTRQGDHGLINAPDLRPWASSHSLGCRSSWFRP